MKLFLDISSSCTGYVLASSKDGKVTIHRIDVLWFEKEASVADKCHHLFEFIVHTFNKEHIDQIIYERYSFNMSRVNGSLVCPQLQGAMLTAASYVGITTDDITPQTWRKNCKVVRKTRDWKKDVEAHFRAIYKLPKTLVSNVTGRDRTTPSDYFDALGVCEGYYRGQGFKEFVYENKDT